MIECFRMKIEHLRYSFDLKKDGAKRPQQIFNLQYSILSFPYQEHPIYEIFQPITRSQTCPLAHGQKTD